MNKRVIVYVLGAVLLIEAALMLLPLLVAVIYREKNGWYFLWVLLGAAVLGALALGLGGRKRSAMYAKEGLIAVALSWIVLSLVGALPFTLSGQIPFYLDAVFEMISGFTTTGSSILPAVEPLDRCMLFWRSLSHWIGGMGILVFMLAIVRMDGGQAIHLLRAESPGPTVSKMVPRMVDSSKILYGIYFGLTVVQILLYLAGGDPLFDSLCNAFGTAGTGGFSIRNAGMSVYSPYSQTVITVFMILFSINFTLYYLLLIGKFRQALRSEEMWVFLGILAAVSLAVAVNILPLFSGFGEAFRHAIFTAASVMSTSGFAISDFNLWPWLSKTLLVVLMFVGACAGSTGGGIKIVRIVIGAKLARRGVQRAIHPQQVKCVHIDGEPLDEDTCSSVSAFLLVYALLFVLLLVLLALEGLDFITTFSAAASCFNNVGPGMELVGPMSNYTCFSSFGKVLLAFSMLFGRLELYPMLLLFIPAAWRK